MKKKGNGLLAFGLLMSLLVFGVMVIGVKNGFILRFDKDIQALFTGIGMVTFFEGVSTMGSTLVIGGGSVLFLVWLWFKEKNYLAMAILAVGVGGGNMLNKFVKTSIARERPVGSLEAEASLNYSFPSGHTMVGLVFYVLIAYFITKAIKASTIKWGLGIAVSVLMLLIGLSRIGLHAHFTSDVIAGYALGAVWSLICVYMYQRISQRLL